MSLAAGIFESGDWPQLLPFLNQCISSGQEVQIENALKIFSELALYLTESLTQYIDHIQQVREVHLPRALLHPRDPQPAPSLPQMCSTFLRHPNEGVKVAALKAASNFIVGLEVPQDRDKFQPLVPDMLAVINHALHHGNEATGQEALEKLIEIAENEPRFLKKDLVGVVQNMMAIAEAESLEAGTRQLAAEFLVTLCEAKDKAPGMMKRVLGAEFAARLFHLMMVFLLDIEDDEQWHSGEREEDESAGEGELFEPGQEYLDRIAFALGGNTLMPVVGVLLPQWMQDQDWRKRNAVLICLAQVAEGCVKQMNKYIPTLVQLCLAGAADRHARVRWSSCQAVGQLCRDLGPDIQEQEHARIVPALLTLMGDAESRVAAHATAALVNFSESADQDDLAQYLDALLNALITLLQGGKRIVQEGALTAIASVADSANELFLKYYDHVMPLLKSIMTGANDRAYRLLRAKSIECITLVGMAVGRDRFRSDAQEVCGYMLKLQAASLDSDDPIHSYMISAWTRMCKILGQEFQPYMDMVMPKLLEVAAFKPDVQFLDAADEHEAGSDDEVEVVPLGNKKLVIKTSMIDEKANACSMISCYADELKELFFPWVQRTAEVMVPMLHFVFSEDVKIAALNSLPELLTSAKLANERGAPGAQDPALVQGLADYMWSELFKLVEKEVQDHENTEPEMLREMLQTMAQLIAAGPQYLKGEQLQKVFDVLDRVAEGFEARRAERIEKKRSEDYDQDELEQLEEEQEVEEEVIDALNDVTNACLKEYREQIMPLVDTKIVPRLARFFEKGRSHQEKRIAICLFDDIIEFASRGGASAK